ncbi:hypothetical protein [Rhodopirellula sp. SWK7]|uniref:hypothetical protein n=1 Tax=Rhodopirellula sp. SWK7 TaxID=595460 RepID=UPI0002C019BB|nr:hypothetical protein [Rhodopirellula sp. SWK7]EMI44410.1 hypothetical protein RRSWK_03211 [Rhodopirellula sp. SWK7]
MLSQIRVRRRDVLNRAEKIEIEPAHPGIDVWQCFTDAKRTRGGMFRAGIRAGVDRLTRRFAAKQSGRRSLEVLKQSHPASRVSAESISLRIACPEDGRIQREKAIPGFRVVARNGHPHRSTSLLAVG